MPVDTPTFDYKPEENESLSTAVVTAISRAKGRDITQDECVLYDNIDPDALNGMFREESEGDSIKVEFTTHDAIVVIWGNGRTTIQVQDLEADPNY
jgi:hypothetical protein